MLNKRFRNNLFALFTSPFRRQDEARRGAGSGLRSRRRRAKSLALVAMSVKDRGQTFLKQLPDKIKSRFDMFWRAPHICGNFSVRMIVVHK
jgi:hypothetical protein